MFVDACAIIALLSDEPEAARVSDAVASARHPFTSPVAILETVLGLARPDKFNLPVPTVETIVMAGASTVTNFLTGSGMMLANAIILSSPYSLLIASRNEPSASVHMLSSHARISPSPCGSMW